MKTARTMKSEILESRICLSASAAVDNGDLVVTGNAEGDIAIIAVGDGLYEVYEAGVLVADSTQLQDVTDDIRVALEETPDGTNDKVSIELGDQTVDRIYADLGDGDNSLVLTGGSAASIVYRGGDGVDDIQLDTAIDEIAWFVLGDGTNTLTVNGIVGRLCARGGSDADTIVFSDTAAIERVSLQLRDGSNEVTHSGTVDGSFQVITGEGDDTVTIEQDASVAGNLRLDLGDGANTVTVEGLIGGSLAISGRDGDDTLVVSQNADVADKLCVRLSDGENTVTVDGTVGGSVNVTSSNAEDEARITVDEDNVAGEVNLSPGEQTTGYYHFSPGRGRLHHHFRGFRHGRR